MRPYIIINIMQKKESLQDIADGHVIASNSTDNQNKFFTFTKLNILNLCSLSLFELKVPYVKKKKQSVQFFFPLWNQLVHLFVPTCNRDEQSPP